MTAASLSIKASLECCIVIVLIVIVQVVAAGKRHLSKRTEAEVTPLHLNSANNTEYLDDVMRKAKVAEMISFMNVSVDPCDDFYEFSCGRFSRINPASDDELTTGIYESLENSMNRKLIAMMKGNVKIANETDIDRKVKDYYASCTSLMNPIERDTYWKELKLMTAEFGAVPMLEGNHWREENFDWLETIGQIGRKYGIQIIFGMDVMPDYKNNSVNRLYFGHPTFELESKSMYVDDITEPYRQTHVDDITTKIMKFMKIGKKSAKRTAQQIFDFERSLAQEMINEPENLGVDDYCQKTTVQEMQQRYGSAIDVERLVAIIVGENITEPVYECQISYQENLMYIIERTPKRVIANYIFYVLLNNFYFDIKSSKVGQEKACILHAKKYFAKNLDNIMHREYGNSIIKDDIINLWNDLKITFKRHLLSRQLKWIRMKTRLNALEKLEAMRLEINSYERFNFTEEFGEVKIVRDDFLANTKNILNRIGRRSIEMLHQPAGPQDDAEQLSSSPANSVSENIVTVPVALLQPYKFWVDTYPHALKYGNLGFLLGHELIHGFDDNGRRYDKYGNVRDWWDERSVEKFNERRDCFSDQYSQYEYYGHKLPYSSSQMENIADNGGVRLAYNAFRRWLEEAMSSGRDMSRETFPDMPYTSEQLFFISFAQMWCNDVQDDVKYYMVYVDEHAPSDYRVIGSLANFPEFANTFNCPANAYMNPSDKCEIY